MDNKNKSNQNSELAAVDVIVFVVHTYITEFRYSIPLDDGDTVADLLEKIHKISHLDDENYFGLFPIGMLSVFREKWPRCHDDRVRFRIPEAEDATQYADQTLVLLYISK